MSGEELIRMVADRLRQQKIPPHDGRILNVIRDISDVANKFEVQGRDGEQK
jgi:hypothetical protein